MSTLKGKFDMRFLKVKGGPSNFNYDNQMYKPGDIVKLPARYANFKWFEPLSPTPRLELPDEDSIFREDHQFSGEGFDMGLSSDLSFQGDKGAMYNPELIGGKRPEDVSTKNFEDMTKKELLKYIDDHGGDAKINWKKEKLVEEAIAVTSPQIF